MSNAYVERTVRAKATANKNIQPNVKYKYKYSKKKLVFFATNSALTVYDKLHLFIWFNL